jgi:hypothetical protein
LQLNYTNVEAVSISIFIELYKFQKLTQGEFLKNRQSTTPTGKRKPFHVRRQVLMQLAG